MFYDYPIFPNVGQGRDNSCMAYTVYDIFVSWYRTWSFCKNFVDLYPAIMTYVENVELIKIKIIAMRRTAVAQILGGAGT